MTLSNSDAREQLRREKLAEVRELGRDSAKGKDSKPVFALKAVQWAQDGIFSADDAKLLYEDYVDSESKKLIHSDNGKQANASKLKQILTLGGMTTVDGVDVLNRAAEAHRNMRIAGLKPKDAYTGFVDVARAQIAAPNAELDDDAIKEVLSKSTKEKSADDMFKAAAKNIEKALEMQLNDDERQRATEALDKVNSALASFISRAEREEKLAKIAELQMQLDLAA